MRYIFAFVKIVILCMLIVTSMYQTGKLWFEDTSDRNFFYSGEDTISTVAEQAGLRTNFILPQQVGVYIGTSDIEYTVVGSGASSFDSIVSSSLEVIAKTLDSGTEVLAPIPPKDLWEQQHILIVLPFEYSSEDFRKGFGLSDTKVQNVAGVSAIYVVPADMENSSLEVYLEDSADGTIHKYMINKNDVTISNEVLSHYLDETLTKEDNAAYKSTRKNRLSDFGSTVLLPFVLDGNIRYHKNIFWETPYVINGEFDEDGVRSMTRTFFDNPDVLSAVVVKDEIRLASGNISVRYNTQGIFEYELIEEVREKTELSEAVALSKQFLSLLEKNAVTEYYLEDYEISEDSITIYYNLGYNGFPVVMSDEARELYGMDYAVEVEVSGHKVIAFKCLIRSIPERLPQFDVFDVPYDIALDSLIVEYGIPLGKPASDKEAGNRIDDMYLGYRWEEEGSAMTLHWVTTIDGETYFVEAE